MKKRKQKKISSNSNKSLSFVHMFFLFVIIFKFLNDSNYNFKKINIEFNDIKFNIEERK